MKKLFGWQENMHLYMKAIFTPASDIEIRRSISGSTSIKMSQI
jgi:hypothetical protein